MTSFATQNDAAATDLELLLLIFGRAGTASQALQSLKKQTDLGRLAILDSAVLIRDRTGETFLFETGHADSRYGVFFGTIVGVLIGVMGGLSPGDERVAGVWTELGFAEAALTWLVAGLRPGGSALVLLVEQNWLKQGLRVLAEFEGEVLQQRAALSTAAKLGSRWEGEP
jgi:uncharacterized membrane protein